MFQFTPEITLTQPWSKRYELLRLSLYALFFLGALAFAFRVFFPSRTFLFLFTGPDQNRSSIVNMRDGQDTAINNGAIKNGPLQFDVFWDEGSTVATVTFFPQSNSAPLDHSLVSVRKTYKAFIYPLSNQAAPLPEGTLLKNNQAFFIVSDGRLRKFLSSTLAESMGFNLNTFAEATDQELLLNEAGENITSATAYPNGTVFVIEGRYYRLDNQTLHQFISDKVFLASYQSAQAVPRPTSFLTQYPLSKEQFGFPSGTLLSFGISAFVVVDDQIRPFNNPRTFLAFGYDWSDIVPASEDEIGLLERAKTFDVNQPHPNGTVFASKENGTYYLILNGERREIQGAIARAVYVKHNPIIVSEESLKIKSICELSARGIFSPRYECQLPIEILNALPGNNYQFEVAVPNGAALNSTSVVFSRAINKENLKLSLLNIKAKILLNYHYAAQ
ncbi:hypothetical protein EPO05_00610 [Patescibacteria group bacterium]|nr:MAG: hypothetical protein EPO05_00610 [Patescibacteria group bacterium]